MAIVAISLVVVAIPVCTACAHSSSALAGMAPLAGMPDMPGMSGTPMAPTAGTALQSLGYAICDMVVSVSNGIETVLPSGLIVLLLSLVGVAAIVAVGGLRFQWMVRKAVPIPARILAPPGSALGVRLLN